MAGCSRSGGGKHHCRRHRMLYLGGCLSEYRLPGRDGRCRRKRKSAALSYGCEDGWQSASKMCCKAVGWVDPMLPTRRTASSVRDFWTLGARVCRVWSSTNARSRCSRTGLITRPRRPVWRPWVGPHRCCSSFLKDLSLDMPLSETSTRALELRRRYFGDGQGRLEGGRSQS
mgnify:CR=1 FL=1